MAFSDILLFCVAVLFVGQASGSYKRWLPDTNFDNPLNWNVRRAPCGNDVTIIPDDSPVVYVQLNTTIKTLVLPKTGELILGRNVNIGFTDTAQDGCPDAGGDVEFTAVHPESWLDPDSWCTSDTERGGCDVTNMILDVERVPCAYDDVVFPRDHAYFVDMTEDTPTMPVKSMKISGSSFTTSTLTTYFNSTEGQRMFRLPTPGGGASKIDITRRACEDVKGCACGNDRKEISSKICSHVEKTCRRPKCSDTIQPVGACCRMCGVIFNITRGYGFDFEGFKRLVNDTFFSDETSRGVNITSSVTSDGWIQMVLSDVTGDKSASLAKQIKAGFNQDLAAGGHKYAIDSFSLSLSTGSSIGPSNPSHSSHTGVSLGKGSIAGIVLAVIIAVAIIIFLIVFFVFRRTGRQIQVPKLPSIHMPSMPSMPNMPSLPRLPRRTPKATARVPPGFFSQPQTASHIDPGFANPLYDSSPFDDGNAVLKEMEMIECKEEQPTFDVSDSGFNNPLYGTQGGSLYSDPTTSEEAAASDDTGVATTSTSGASPTDTTVIIEHQSASNSDSVI